MGKRRKPDIYTVLAVEWNVEQQMGGPAAVAGFRYALWLAGVDPTFAGGIRVAQDMEAIRIGHPRQRAPMPTCGGGSPASTRWPRT